MSHDILDMNVNMMFIMMMTGRLEHLRRHHQAEEAFPHTEPRRFGARLSYDARRPAEG